MTSTLSAQWNTGRLYQRDGQRIRAELVAGDAPVILFADFSRMIYGEIVLNPALPLPADARALRDRTMRGYDAPAQTGGYRMSCAAMKLRWED